MGILGDIFSNLEKANNFKLNKIKLYLRRCELLDRLGNYNRLFNHSFHCRLKKTKYANKINEQYIIIKILQIAATKPTRSME